jgi:hypothetical protein
MKMKDLQTKHFRDLTAPEMCSCNGGSFAYDVGRLIRFVILAGPQGQFTPMAFTDAVLNHFQ